MLAVRQLSEVDDHAYHCGSDPSAFFRDEFATPTRQVTVHPEWLPSREEALEWAKVKSDNLPTFSGSPQWRNYLTFLEQKLRSVGVVDVSRNAWTYDRWHTSDDSKDWSLTSDGVPIRTRSLRSAAGVIVVYDMAFDRVNGMYTFLVPTLYNAPTLTLSREDGARVIADAKAGKTGTLRLEAVTEKAKTYQLIAYLPGKDYGTPRDEQVLLITHTDGPSISQENGPLGLLAIVKYYANVPQRQRNRTLTVFLDCRHYMPGFEAAFTSQTWLNRFPQARRKLVGLIQMEHLGEKEYREIDGRVEPTGLNEHS